MELNEEKLVALLEKHFPTKVEFGVATNDISVLKTDVAVLKTDVSSLKTEFSSLRNEMREGFEMLNERFLELKASASTLDNVLEKHPIERIERLEKHNKLPVFKLQLAAE